MKLIKLLLPLISLLVGASAIAADPPLNTRFGDSEVFYDYRVTDSGLASLTLIGVVTETNNQLRGLKNSDRRRLGKLGQLIYQCKLMLYKPDKKASTDKIRDPVLLSNNYSLFTDVDLQLRAGERVGIQAQALPAVDEEILFSPLAGGGQLARDVWKTIGEGSALNLRQIDVNVVVGPELIANSESIDINIRFPVFQMEKPVNQWSYNFNLADFNRAHRYIDENCTPARLLGLIETNS